MKKIILGIVLAISLGALAQIKTPKPSPKAKLEQQVGLTDVTVEYYRPSKKGRTVFGKLVPNDILWRTGANGNTKVTFSNDVEINGQTLTKGSYALYTKPKTNEWEVFFYTDSDNWGTPKKWDDKKVALKTTIKPESMPKDFETFTIMFGNLTNHSATLDLIWEKTIASIPFKVPTNKIVDQNIKTGIAKATANDYYRIAQYYYSENKDIKKATEWIDKAVALDAEKPKFWVVHFQALIHKKAGDIKGAKKAAKRSLKLSKNAGYYTSFVKKNEELLKTL